MAGKLLNLPSKPWVRPSWCRHSDHEFPGFHICLDLSRPEHPLAAKIVETRNAREGGAKKPAKTVPHNKGKTMSAEARKKISDAQRKRWAALRAG